ncbi:C2H2-type zinc finger protein [Endozoicomonas gorgoniicola]|uniref:C2H2-type zinc finger protein n=1 Tax=Endozoicomonas gorgoniicola TaxID=1234144 RepID=UPI0038993741
MPFRCSKCGRNCTTQYKLTRHMLTHTGDKPYSCDFCGQDFANASNLTIHKRTHTGEKPYSCEVCAKNFSHSSNLTRHMRTHTGEKPYICEVCAKSFTGKSDLARHMQTHTGQKFLCPICRAGYARRDRLNEHIEKRHPAPNTPDTTVFTQASAGVVTTTHSFNSGPSSPTTISVSYISSSTEEEKTPVRVVTNSTPLAETIIVTQHDGKVITTIQPRAESDPHNPSSQ